MTGCLAFLKITVVTAATHKMAARSISRLRAPPLVAAEPVVPSISIPGIALPGR